ncbi:hypothetical protein dsx2_0356 [Desulfovibrio sp. X2]|uniref:tetratricopeptide repeat protein n=1 Tax=Desulfovibrio sp. X2 TaxID=941449 RepID=UPI000358B35E|nr:tetratricopeptide repeat protein [Desulfovibrio sp. X2]EPR39782.1 hypothetical protein dsx2_0356 [Desulfovibrio sp. X2]
MNRSKGIFSSIEADESGGEARKVYWTVRELADGDFRVQPLSRNFVPAGPSRVVKRAAFLAGFEAEPEFYVESVAHKRQEADDILGLGSYDDPRALPLAGVDLAAAQRINEENVRASFDAALMLLEAGHEAKARAVFERILNLSAPFDPEHKHLFNALGIRLRKAGLYDLALRCYERAADLAPDDDHLLFNMGRALYEKGEPAMARARLEKSLLLNPDLSASRRFVRFIAARAARAAARARVYRRPSRD